MNWRGLCHGRGGLLAAAAVLALIAGMLPPLSLHRTRPVVDHLVIFDVTQSMNVADVSMNGVATGRLAFAKRALIDALPHLPCGSRVGLGVFSGHRTLALLAPVEVCGNRYELAEAITQIDTRMAWNQASQIARGVYSAIDVALEFPRPPTVMFVTDGHEAPPLPDADLRIYDKPDQRLRGMLLGVGSRTPQPIPRTDRDGRPLGWWSADEVVQRPAAPGQPPSHEELSYLHETHLQALAAASGLDYRRLDAPSVLREALTDPRLMRTEQVQTDARWIPAVLAGLALCAFYWPAAWMPRRRRARAVRAVPRT